MELYSALLAFVGVSCLIVTAIIVFHYRRGIKEFNRINNNLTNDLIESNKEKRETSDLNLKQTVMIGSKTQKIESLMEQIAELSEFKKRVVTLEDNTLKFEATNLRMNVTKIDSPLTTEDLKILLKMMGDVYSKGGTRKGLTNIFSIHDKIEMMAKSSVSYHKVQKDVDRAHAEATKTEKKSVNSNKHMIGKVK